MSDTEQPDEPVTPQPPEATSTSNDDDDLESLLSEFGAETKAAPDKPEKSDFARRILDTLPKPTDPRDLEIRELRERQALVEEWAVGLQAEKLAEIDRQDAEAVFAEARPMLPDYAPDDFERMWFRNELLTNNKLANAWTSRHDGDGASAAFKKELGAAMKRFRAAASRLAEPKLSEDKALVAAAVRGSASKPPLEVPPNYSDMSDQQFAAAVQKQHGFRPKL